MKFNYLLTLGFLVCTSIFHTGCSDRESAEEITNHKMNGSWEVLSYRLGGLEQLNISVESIELKFDKTGDESGLATITYKYLNTQVVTEHGDYEIEDDGTTLILRGTTYDLEITGDDQLYMAGTPNGVSAVWNATKK